MYVYVWKNYCRGDIIQVILDTGRLAKHNKTCLRVFFLGDLPT